MPIWKSQSLAEKLRLLQRDPKRLLEIHLSDNNGYQDSHTTISDQTWWIPYIALFPTQVPLVLESRMNRLGAEQLRQQVEALESRLSTSRHRSLTAPTKNHSSNS